MDEKCVNCGEHPVKGMPEGPQDFKLVQCGKKKQKLDPELAVNATNLHDLKLQVLMQNPCISGIPLNDDGPDEFEKKWPVLKNPYGGKSEESDDVRGLLVVYLDVGSLPPFKAEAYVERMKVAFLGDGKGSVSSRIKKHREIWFIPTRTGRTKVEYIPFGDY